MKEASKALGISENVAYQRLLRIRERYHTAKKIVEEVEKYREGLKVPEGVSTRG